MKKIILAILTLSLLVACGGKVDKNFIQIKGSDTVLNLGQSVSELYMKKNSKVKISVTGGGSGTGIAAILNKTTDIAQASRDIKQKELDAGKKAGLDIKEYIIAYDGITVIVNKNNPIKNLTSEQIRGIFVGDIKNWKELGGKDEKIVALSRDSSSGTHLFFKEHILRRGNEKGPEEYRADALFLPSNQAILGEVENSTACIGYIGMGYMKDTVKALTVDGVAATVQNVSDKKYPVARSLNWYIVGELKGTMKDFVDFMMSKEGQEIVAKEGFVPVK